MREPTRDEMIEGIKQAVLAFLSEREMYAPYYKRPLHIFREAMAETLSQWLKSREVK